MAPTSLLFPNCFFRNLYAIPGLDYVAHEDILPYKTNETNPLQVDYSHKIILDRRSNHPHPLCFTCIDHLSLLLQHELFDKFLMFSEGREPPFQAQDTLRAWQEKVKSLCPVLHLDLTRLSLTPHSSEPPLA